MVMAPDAEALVEVGRWLMASGYRFVTPTPATHARVNRRARHREVHPLTAALGWSRPFRAGTLPHPVEHQLERAGALLIEGDLRRSAVRFSTLDAAPGDPRAPAVLVHSAFPTAAADSVFFGPDTYRFVALLRRTLRPAGRLVDVGAGTGAGGLAVADRVATVILADINRAALRLAAVNAAIAGAGVEIVESDVLSAVPGRIDAIVSNPPYLADPHHRVYRDGGGALGFDLSVRIAREALGRLAPGGQLILYTGSPVIHGEHPLRDALAPHLAAARCRHTWEELDPDVFGDELDEPAYGEVERIAAIGVAVVMP